jgi:hypothetical protein
MGRFGAIIVAIGLMLAGIVGLPASAGASVSAPSWWGGTTCDTGNYSGSYALGASYNGVIACGPGPAHQGGSDHLVHFYSGAWGEYEWECVELVMRYMYLVYGIAPYSANGYQVVSNYSGSILTKVSNNDTSLPSPGDIIAEGNGTNANHTGVVTAVNVTSGSGTVTIMEEDGPATSGTYTGYSTITVSGGVLGSYVTGWLHDSNGSGGADNFNHVYSSTVSGDINETYWGNGVSPTTGSPLASLGAQVNSIVGYRTSDGVNHVYSGTVNGDIYETYWGAGYGVTTSHLANVGSSAASISASRTSDGVNHVYVGTVSGDEYEIYWGGGNSLTVSHLSNVGAGITSISAFRTSDGVNHVYSSTVSGNIYETYWGGGYSVTTGSLAAIGTQVTSISGSRT